MSSVFFDKKKYGQRIRATRQRLGLEQSDVAAATGITQATLSRVENGRSNPTQATLEKLQSVLGVTAEEFTLTIAKALGAIEQTEDANYSIGGISVDRRTLEDAIKEFPVLKYVILKAIDKDVEGFNNEIRMYAQKISSGSQVATHAAV